MQRDALYFYFILAYWTIDYIEKHWEPDKNELKFQKGAVQWCHEWL